MIPELQTERLVVRLAQPGMQAPIARFLAENLPGHLDRWSPPVAPELLTEAFWAERLPVAVDDYRGDRAARFAIQLRGASLADTIVGTCNYTNIVRGAFHACHLGYQVAREYQGRGMMAEALRATNAFVFERMRLHRIMANFRPENERSRQLLKRLGFAEEGFAKEYLFIDGAWRDHVLTSLVNPAFRDEWVTMRS